MSCIAISDVRRVETYLRRKLGCATLAIDVPARSHATAELRVGRDVVGTVDEVDDEGERSWVATLIVLPEDLAG